MITGIAQETLKELYRRVDELNIAIDADELAEVLPDYVFYKQQVPLGEMLERIMLGRRFPDEPGDNIADE